MIDYLYEKSITKETIEKLYNNDNIDILSLNSNEEECKKTIDYLRSIGVNCIEDLLINRIELFYNSKYEVEKIFSKYNIPELVSKINDNYEEIDKIMY